jgi:hypothetical protein
VFSYSRIGIAAHRQNRATIAGPAFHDAAMQRTAKLNRHVADRTGVTVGYKHVFAYRKTGAKSGYPYFVAGFVRFLRPFRVCLV